MRGGGICRPRPVTPVPSRSCVCSLSLHRREGECEPCTPPFLRLAPDLSARVLDHQPHQVQSEPGPFRFPGDRVVGPVELLEQAACAARGMPMPLSRTLHSTRFLRGMIAMSIRPPSAVYLTAFDTRLAITCRIIC